MNNFEVERFIETYKKYYFPVSKEEKKYGIEKLGISIIHPTKEDDEAKIIENLNKGEQSIKTISWKMGGIVSNEGIRTQYHEYSSNIIEEFCRKTKGMQLSIKKEKTIEDQHIRESYDEILKIVQECDLVGYGSVYIISTMFFLSSGRIPIYDYYANVAVKALLWNCNPQEIYVVQAPAKEEHARGNKDKKLAVNMLLEYMRLLSELVGNTNHYMQNGYYITRELDQALWVYGHSTKKYVINLIE